MEVSDDYSQCIPRPKDPLGNYKSVSYSNGIGKISGQFPISKEGILITGKFGKEVSSAQMDTVASYVALNILAHLNALNDTIELLSLIHIDCYVQSVLNDQHLISLVNQVSSVLTTALGVTGEHSRSLVIVSDLPFNAMMEVVTTFSYKT